MNTSVHKCDCTQCKLYGNCADSLKLLRLTNRITHVTESMPQVKAVVAIECCKKK